MEPARSAAKWPCAPASGLCSGRARRCPGRRAESAGRKVTVWEPGHRLVHTFTLAQDPEHPSEVAAEFVPTAEGCTVRFAHGGWTDANVAARKRFSDWPVMLDRFAALADYEA